MVTLKMVVAVVIAIMGAVTVAPGGSSSAQVRARLQTPLAELNDGKGVQTADGDDVHLLGIERQWFRDQRYGHQDEHHSQRDRAGSRL